MKDAANILPDMPDDPQASHLPYKIACLCDLRDKDGRVLLLHRIKAPNKGLCSPIGGKLEMHTGESPAQCAIREIKEEAGIDVRPQDLHLAGLIAETAFEGKTHWLLFYYRVMVPVEVVDGHMDEGELQWHHPDEIEKLPLPGTDREIIWPMINRHQRSGPNGTPGFFNIHIDCRGEKLAWTVEQETPLQSD
ncbi:MAG: NUDIX domain-containing protein [Phycisphaerales bacterium]